METSTHAFSAPASSSSAPAGADTVTTVGDVRIQIMSNLRLRGEQCDVFHIIPKARNLALLGNIGSIHDEGLFRFLRRQLAQFEVVFYIMGPMEHSVMSKADAWRKLKNFANKHKILLGGSQFVPMNRFCYNISPMVTVLGCTLYSHFPAGLPYYVATAVEEFQSNYDWNTTTYNRCHRREVKWLEETVGDLAVWNPEVRLIVLTHYSPSIDHTAIHPFHRIRPTVHAFGTDLSQNDFWDNNCVKAWAFGHTGWNCDFIGVGGKRLVTDQKEPAPSPEALAMVAVPPPPFEGGKVIIA